MDKSPVNSEWSTLNTDKTIKKALTRIRILAKLYHVGISNKIILTRYKLFIESVLGYHLVVTPVPKIKQPSMYKHVRPILLLCHLGKLAEQAIVNKLKDH